MLLVSRMWTHAFCINVQFINNENKPAIVNVLKRDAGMRKENHLSMKINICKSQDTAL